MPRGSSEEYTVSRGVTLALHACIIIMVMLLCSCGLYSYPYIYAPSLQGGTASTAQHEVTIIHDGDNDPAVFRGYEIYYKFYNSTTAYDDQRKDHNSIFSVKEPDYTALRAAGYTRCRTVKLFKKDTPTPMLPVPTGSRDDDFDLYINFAPIALKDFYKEELFISYLNEAVPLYRAIKDLNPDTGEREAAGGKADDDIYKDFNSDDVEYNSTYKDSDLPGTEQATLSMYIIGYGIHENHNLYSKPVWLGLVDCWK